MLCEKKKLYDNNQQIHTKKMNIQNKSEIEREQQVHKSFNFIQTFIDVKFYF